MGAGSGAGVGAGWTSGVLMTHAIAKPQMNETTAASAMRSGSCVFLVAMEPIVSQIPDG
jgi:hypothetical protein